MIDADSLIKAMTAQIDSRWGHYYRICHKISGSYGLVFILESRLDDALHVNPKRFAIKTIRPDVLLHRGASVDAEALFRREIGKWLGISFHPNVLVPTLLEFFQIESFRIPWVSMPYCESTLREWIDQEYTTRPIVDRLLALAQMLNGLSWLYYDQGIEGHGDLKPENVLIQDLRAEYNLPSVGFPSQQHPWLIRISDLGWADVWIDLGFSDRGWQPYMAPERYEGRVEPVRGDMFSVGVIAAELLQGKHPCGRPVKELHSKGRSWWKRWANLGSRDLSGIEPPELQAVIAACLNKDPQARPLPRDVIEVVSQIAGGYGIPVLEVLGALNDYAAKTKASAPGQAHWTVEQVARLSPQDLDAAIDRTRCEHMLLEPSVKPGVWLLTSRTLWRLLGMRGSDEDRAEREALAREVLDFVLRNWESLDVRSHIYGEELTKSAGLHPKEVLEEFVQEALTVLRECH